MILWNLSLNHCKWQKMMFELIYKRIHQTMKIFSSKLLLLSLLLSKENKCWHLTLTPQQFVIYDRYEICHIILTLKQMPACNNTSYLSGLNKIHFKSHLPSWLVQTQYQNNEWTSLPSNSVKNFCWAPLGSLNQKQIKVDPNYATAVCYTRLWKLHFHPQW